MRSSELDRPAQPAASYAAARARFEAGLAQDSPAIDAASRSQLIGPGHRTERVVVFFHGLTNSPQQFLRLATRFTQHGYTVLIPRLPFHG